MPPLSNPVVLYPLINGHRYSFASIELTANFLPFVGIKSINYSQELEPGDVYGTGSNKIGRTRGKANASCDFEMYRFEWENLKVTLGRGGIGYGEQPFNITVCYAEAAILGIPQPVITDLIEGVRITKAEFSNQEGSDATTVKLTTNVMRVKEGVALQTITGLSFNGGL